MKKLFIINIQLAITCFLFAGVVAAQSPSSSDIREAVQQKVAQELANIKQAVAKKGFVGSITANSEGTLTISNLKSQSRTAIVAPDATIRLAGNKEGTTEDLEVDDFVLAMGDVDSTNKMTIKRLLVLAAFVPDKRVTTFGTVTVVTGTTLAIENLANEKWTVRTSSSTTVTTAEDGDTVSAKVADLEEGDKIVILGTPPANTQNTLSASLLHILPSAE